MSKNIECYHELKDFFMQNLQNGDLPCEFLFKEDKDNLVLHFNVKNESVSVDYYYVFGDMFPCCFTCEVADTSLNLCFYTEYSVC